MFLEMFFFSSLDISDNNHFYIVLNENAFLIDIIVVYALIEVLSWDTGIS